MRTYLCVVSPRFPENYHIGVQSGKWGVEDVYRNRIENVRPGDELVFITGQCIVSLHRIESAVFREELPLWPKKDGDIFPWRIRISGPIYKGVIPKEDFCSRISFMVGKVWGGTIQGASGVFNDRLTGADLAFIKSKLKSVSELDEDTPAIRTNQITYTAETAKALFKFFERDVLSALSRLLPALGLRRYNGKDFPGEYDLGYGGNVVLCVDNRTGDLVVVDFNRGEAPNETLLRLLHYMSWVRQHLADKNDVYGIILAESANQSLSAIVKEVPNVSIKCYRLGIELIGDQSA